MKHIVLPTDFSIRSLQPVHDIVRQYRNEVIKITALHLVHLPIGIGDLLFRYNRIADRFPVPEAFAEACQVMSNRYESQIISVHPLIKFGSTAAYLENLLKGMAVDALYMQAGYKEEAAFKDSVAMLPLINKIDYNIVQTTSVKRSEPVPSLASVGDLLLVGS